MGTIMWPRGRGPTLNLTEVCIMLPPKVNSPGFGEYLKDAKYNMLDYSMPRFQLHMVMIFAITQSSHFVLKRLGLPMFISQIIAGLVLGPTVLGKKAEILFPEKSIEVLGAVGALGYALFMFQIGVKIDMSRVTRVGRKALCIGVVSVIVPLLVSLATIKIITKSKQVEFATFFFSAIVCSMTSFPVVTSLLNDMKILNSELGRLGQSSAIVGDMLTLVLLVTSAATRIAFLDSLSSSLKFLEVVIGYVIFVAFVLRPAMSWVVRRTPEGKPVDDLYICGIIFGFLLSVAISKWFATFILLGPYILGLAVPDGPPLGSFLVDKFDNMISGLLFPLFVSTCSMRLETLHVKFDNDLMITDAIIIGVSILAKFGSCLLPLLYSSMPGKDSLALALIMCSKGIFEIATYSFLSDRMVITEGMFSLMAITIIILSSIVPILVRFLYDPSRKYAGYEKRSIIHSKPNAELQILACIHVPNNVSAIINLLEASYPTRESPIAVNVLHLIKLSGQATPLFFSHQKKNKAISINSYSENVILSFDRFEGNNWGVVTVDAFTAISPTNLMHEDICTLALDKMSSLIILPFHRRWLIDGSVESDDPAIRALNCKVIERAPCSIGILIDRGNLRRPLSSDSLYNIGMIFLGGNDDQEALMFAKRMAQDTRSRLTVIHLVAVDDDGVTNWDKMLDAEILIDVRTNKYIRYIEKETKDGPETAFIIRSLVDEYDLIIVGRRDDLNTPQTSGLIEWSELPELGVLGDMLASKDFDGKSSVLVMQQQQTSN